MMFNSSKVNITRDHMAAFLRECMLNESEDSDPEDFADFKV